MTMMITTTTNNNNPTTKTKIALHEQYQDLFNQHCHSISYCHLCQHWRGWTLRASFHCIKKSVIKLGCENSNSLCGT